METMESESLSPFSPSETPPTQERGYQFAKQWNALIALYNRIPLNVLDDEIKQVLQQILLSLQTFTISNLLAESYDAEVLAKYKTYALEEFEKMGQINRERMQSLVALSTPEMQRVLMETLLIFDTNEPTLVLKVSERKTTIDENGHPIQRTRTFPVFQEGALSGIDGLKRFIPQSLLAGDQEKEILGMDSFLKSQFATLSTKLETATNPYIKAISTIGSLGGISHKSNSDMDAQIILDTSPEFKDRWNDADFFIALLLRIFQHLIQDIYENTLLPSEHSKLEAAVEEEMREKYGEPLSEDEQQVIALLLPSVYQRTLEQKIWEKFYELESSQQALLLWRKIAEILGQYPYFEKFITPLSRFFSFIKVNYEDKQIREEWFPYSLSILSKERVFKWMADFYQQGYLDEGDAQQMVQHYAQKHNIDRASVSEATQQEIFLDHLAEINQRGPVIKNFLKNLMRHVSLDSQHRLSDVLYILERKFDRNRHFLNSTFVRELDEELKQTFRTQMVRLIDFYSEQQALDLEAQCEFAVRQKITLAEQYLKTKYPETEVHFFTNILRNQRVGRHTPFLVSIEGSMAYDLMLNDFLLNPAVLLSGLSPIPFGLPHDLKVLCRIGALPEKEWMLKQTHGETVEEFPLRTLPDWGEREVPRQKFWEHAIPIFLRESEKISHRNLPKALLNCWWVEMICLEEEEQPLTNLTQLLFNPDERYFIREELNTPCIQFIQMMEKEYAQLVRDPWWIKFTEMLSRFEDEEIQEQMIFCFSQHIQLSDIINFNNNGQPIWLEDDASWRLKALVSFYNFFYESEEQRDHQVKFAQGRDDVANRVEKKLKILFLQSLQRVEQKLLSVQNNKALKALMGYVLKMGGDTIGPKAKAVAAYTLEQLQELHQNILIVDESIVQKVETEQALSDIETMQWEIIQEDRQRLQKTVTELIEYYQPLGLMPDAQIIEDCILESRLKLAGDPLENVIFKYHFERNFKRKAYQIPFPISKTLSIPRKRIMLDFNSKKQKWIFKSILSKKEVLRQTSRYAGRAENEIEMFEAPLVEGIARCVINGYIGFSSHNLTSFEKPPTLSKGTIATNPINHQEVLLLATEMKEFFEPIAIRSRELLENTHYIRDIFMVCNANRFSSISLMVRDNFGNFFVIGFNLDRIQVQIPPSFLKVDFNLSRFFLQFNTRKCRRLFISTLGTLNIPLRVEYSSRFKIWINPGNFNLLVAPKFHRIYLDGIIRSLWSTDLLGTADFLKPKKLVHTFDFMGKEAIKNREKETYV